MVLMDRAGHVAEGIIYRRSNGTSWADEPWQVKATTILPGIYIFAALIVAVLCSIALARTPGKKSPFVALLFAIIFFMLNEAAWLAYYFLWMLPDGFQTQSSRRTLFSISAAAITLDQWETAFTLLALVLWISRRRRALIAALREKQSTNVLRKAFISILIFLMFANGLVLGTLEGATVTSFWEAKLDGDDFEDRRTALKALGILAVGLNGCILIYLVFAVTILRKEMANVGQRDKPTNTVAWVALPLACIVWAYDAFSTLRNHFHAGFNLDNKYTWALVSDIVYGVLPLMIFFSLSIRGIRTASWDTLGEVTKPEEKRGTYMPIEDQNFPGQNPSVVFKDPYMSEASLHSRASSSTAYLPTYESNSIHSGYDHKKNEKGWEHVELSAQALPSQYSTPPSYTSRV